METTAAAFIMGLAGSLHCLGMCGPIAMALPLNRESSLTKTIGILSYNTGRITTYTFLGIILGLFGTGLRLAGILQYVSVFIGVIIITSVILPRLLKKINFTNKYLYQFNTWIKTKLGKLLIIKSNASLFFLGTLNGLLPCGIVWIAMIGSIAHGNIYTGANFMLFFGLGTLPLMFSLSFFTNSISATFKSKLRKLVPVVVIVFGALFIMRGLNLDIPYISPSLNENGTEIKSCCQHHKK